MISRRTALSTAIAAFATAKGSAGFGQTSPRLLFVHGRAQGGRDAQEIRNEWVAAFQEGARAAGVAPPSNVDVRLPFYGDELDRLTREFSVPLASEITTKGNKAQDDFLTFQEEIANEMRRGAGIEDDQVDELYGDNPREKGPQNWEWVQAIIAALDKHAGSLSTDAIELFLRDVFLYISYTSVQNSINAIVTAQMSSQPTVVVAHSLGTVVTYNILSQGAVYDVPLFVTLGSPLGIRAIRRKFSPIRHPASVDTWVNAMDTRDIVALHPLDQDNFDVRPAISNIVSIRNQTRNRHGISGYLDKPSVVSKVVAAL
ncbi:alpha/beta hydrolase [uncultured Tateyamaria sp.]|uniref:alpha/beta hydrolase n=1 Tax=uncultured Tateyamaria sp. TaxID=455651 RepID=UPI0026076874|nr:alpha/beta hydrolase [uncultured Tateyamaria sp.]